MADPTAYPPRPQARGGTYAPFIPASVAERPFPLGPEAAAASAQAERALADLRSLKPRLTSAEALARSLVAIESLASSRIEGVHASPERLARVAHSCSSRGWAGESRAFEVLGHVGALTEALAIGAGGAPFTVAHIKDIHRALLGLSDDRDVAGVIREGQHWIGGDDYNPVGADFVPPPPEKLWGFLADLCGFLAREDLPAPAQAAIAHAQFKNIHPFAAGNGRTGRALVYAVLRRRGAVGEIVPPLSPVIASQPKAYVGGLGAYSVGRVEVWCENFAHALARAAREASVLADAIEARVAEWLERLGNPRSDSAVRQILRELPGHPVLDAGLAEGLTRKSHTAVHNALNQLEGAGVLQPVDDRRWGRVWGAGELLGLFAEFERRVSSGRG